MQSWSICMHPPGSGPVRIDIMLMYTDGLIERPGEDLTEGIARVAERLQAWQPGAPLGSLCDDMIASLAAQPQLDDMCVLAVTRPESGRTCEEAP